MGHHAAVVAQLDATATTVAQLCEALTSLSVQLWDTYQRPARTTRTISRNGSYWNPSAAWSSPEC